MIHLSPGIIKETKRIKEIDLEFFNHEKKGKMAASAFVGGSQENVKDVSSTSASCKEAWKESSNALKKRVLGT